MIYIASDHRGYQLKKELVDFIKTKLDKEIIDLGPDKYDEDDDFVDFAIPLAKKVSADKNLFGILICGTGHGMCIAANKINGARAIVG